MCALFHDRILRICAPRIEREIFSMFCMQCFKTLANHRTLFLPTLTGLQHVAPRPTKQVTDDKGNWADICFAPRTDNRMWWLLTSVHRRKTLYSAEVSCFAPDASPHCSFCPGNSRIGSLHRSSANRSLDVREMTLASTAEACLESSDEHRLQRHKQS